MFHLRLSGCAVCQHLFVGNSPLGVLVMTVTQRKLPEGAGNTTGTEIRWMLSGVEQKETHTERDWAILLIRFSSLNNYKVSCWIFATAHTTTHRIWPICPSQQQQKIKKSYQILDCQLRQSRSPSSLRPLRITAIFFLDDGRAILSFLGPLRRLLNMRWALKKPWPLFRTQNVVSGE